MVWNARIIIRKIRMGKLKSLKLSMPILSSISVFYERLVANEKKITETKESEAQYYASLRQTTRNILTLTSGY